MQRVFVQLPPRWNSQRLRAVTAVFGREREVALADAFLKGEAGDCRFFVFEGEAGMGKTTLWLAGVQRARELGFEVLEARPAASEGELSFAGLGDLLGRWNEDLGDLPGPQRRALRIALLLEESGGKAPDPRAVGAAVLGLFRRIAAREKLLIAIDDVQWLDAATSAAVAYAARRLRDAPIGLLLARRAAVGSALLDELRRSVGAERYIELEVRALDPIGLHQVVEAHFGVSFTRPLLADVHKASGGNPLYALEIVRTLLRRGTPLEPGQPLPVPDSLHELVHDRLIALPSESRSFLLAAAALSHPTVQLVESATRITRADGLRPALEAGVVELDGDRMRFTHPLVAAGAYAMADPLRRAEMHARLAEVVDDPEARAAHLAASVSEPDEAIAAALEEAAAGARARGAPRSAALMLDRARDLTPPDRNDEGFRRSIDAAYLHFESGDSARAETRLRDVIGELPRGPKRARALMRLAMVRSFEQQREAVELFLQAIQEADADRGVLAVAHEGVSSCLFGLRHRLDDAVEHAKQAVEFAFELGDMALAAQALGSQLQPETLLGRETAAKTAARALELQHDASDQRILSQPLWVASVYWWWTDEIQRAHDASLEMLRRARELGDESSAPYVLVLLGSIECALGRLDTGLQRALEGRELARQSGQPALVANHLAFEGLVEAQRGREEQARSAATLALELVPMTGGGLATLLATWALGHLELSLGNPQAAVEALAPTVALAQREGFGEPAATRYVVDEIEGLIELGRRNEAIELLDWYEGNARRLERVSALANCARCRATLAAKENDIDASLAIYDDALAWHSKTELPLDRGRTLLALGAAQRRAKHRREARETLGEALAIFDGIGASLWSDRARAELKRISGRVAIPGALTPAEERIAALAAEGKTNREVAAALFLSDRTVEGHLSRVYGKLGVRSRAELIARLAKQPPPPSDDGGRY